MAVVVVENTGRDSYYDGNDSAIYRDGVLTWTGYSWGLDEIIAAVGVEHDFHRINDRDLGYFPDRLEYLNLP